GPARNNLADALGALGRIDEAIVEETKAVRVDPDDAQWRCNLGVLLRARGDLPAAAREFEAALRIDPGDAAARAAAEDLARRGVGAARAAFPGLPSNVAAGRQSATAAVATSASQRGHSSRQAASISRAVTTRRTRMRAASGGARCVGPRTSTASCPAAAAAF